MKSLVNMLRLSIVLAVLLTAVSLALPPAHGQQPFYKDKRLTILINFAPGGSTDTEGRLFARHIGRHIEGQPNVIVQNMEGAGGVIGAKYVGEVAPRDGTVVGYFTATAFISMLTPERFQPNFTSYEFIATQGGTTVHFIRSDVEPGMREAGDILRAKGVVIGGLSPESPKALRGRLIFDMLGVPHGFIGAYRSGGAAKLAFERNEVNVFSESPPSYRAIIEPDLVRTGKAIPLFYDAGYDGENFFMPSSLKGLPLPAFHEFFQTVKGAMPSGTLWDAYKGILGADGIAQRLIALPPGAPPAAVAALRGAVARLNKDPAHAADAQKLFGYVPEWLATAETNTVLRRAVSVAPETRAFLVNYVKSWPK